MLKITVEGNKEEIKKAKNELHAVCFLDKDCVESCEECEKGKIEIKYVVKEDK